MPTSRFEEPEAATVVEVAEALRLGLPPAEVSALLVGAALHDGDRTGVQDLCLDLMAGADREVAAVAATCLGHLARIHRELDVDRVVPALTAALRDPATAGRADDALDDLETYLPSTAM